MEKNIKKNPLGGNNGIGLCRIWNFSIFNVLLSCDPVMVWCNFFHTQTLNHLQKAQRTPLGESGDERRRKMSIIWPFVENPKSLEEKFDDFIEHFRFKDLDDFKRWISGCYSIGLNPLTSLRASIKGYPYIDNIDVRFSKRYKDYMGKKISDVSLRRKGTSVLWVFVHPRNFKVELHFTKTIG